MKIQALACAVAIVSGSLFFSNTINNAFAETAAPISALTPTRQQEQVAKQVATMVDRQHYLNMHLDTNVSKRVLDMYFDNLDPEHMLFLQSDVDEFRKKYASNLGDKLKRGDLSPAVDIYQRYRMRVDSFYQYSMAQLDVPQNLHRSDFIDIDREKAPFFATQAEQREYWQKKLVSQLISLTMSKEEEQGKQNALKANPDLAAGQDLSPPEDLTPVNTLKKRFKRQMEQQKRIKNDRVVESVLNALLATYDPHSNFYAPVEAMELRRQTTLALEGIGVSIRPERGNEDYTKIETIVDGGPAGKSGQVRAGDRIIGVGQDGEAIVDVIGWPSTEIVGLIRGKRGTKVTLRLLATGAAANQTRVVTLTRDVIQEEDARLRSRVITVKRDDGEHKVGVLEIPSFYLNYNARSKGDTYRSVSEDTQAALIDLQQKGVEGVVFDLRNNPGGNLDDVVSMMGLVIKSGPVVQTRYSNGEESVLRDNDGGEQTYAGPLAVIVNLGSASASEIFSAAVQDYQRGIVIGSTTLGKGTAQEVNDRLLYPDSTLTLTKRKFYRITGGSTQNKGVIPDVPLVNIYDEDLGERKARNALQWDTIRTASFKREGVIAPFVPALDSLSAQRVVDNPQFNYLKALKQLSEKTKNEKQWPLNIDARKKQTLELEASQLAVENKRRSLTGEQPYANWESYQAALDARTEARAKMKAAQRPQLPEDEAYVTESANILLDMVKLQKANPTLTANDPPLPVPASAAPASPTVSAAASVAAK